MQMEVWNRNLVAPDVSALQRQKKLVSERRHCREEGMMVEDYFWDGGSCGVVLEQATRDLIHASVEGFATTGATIGTGKRRN
jgi:hypothetical protein